MDPVENIEEERLEGEEGPGQLEEEEPGQLEERGWRSTWEYIQSKNSKLVVFVLIPLMGLLAHILWRRVRSEFERIFEDLLDEELKQ